jgi:Domain of unknown function (DUF1906)
MTQLLIDVSYARPNPTYIRSAGYIGVIGYISPEPTKNMTPVYATALQAAGLGVLLVWESTAQQALGGAASGRSDAVQAVMLANALKYPNGSPLFVNIGDFAATEDQIPFIRSYYEAFAAGINPRMAGGYGTGYIINQLAPVCTGIWWQNAMDDEGVPGSTITPHTAIYQRTSITLSPIPGGGYDEDVLVNNIPVQLWLGVAPIPTPTPKPVVVTTTSAVDGTIGGLSMNQNTIVIGPLDSSGSGAFQMDGNTGTAPGVESQNPAIAWNTVVSVFAIGSDPSADDGYATHVARAQERAGFTLVSVTNGPPGGTAAVLVVTTS